MMANGRINRCWWGKYVSRRAECSIGLQKIAQGHVGFSIGVKRNADESAYSIRIVETKRSARFRKNASAISRCDIFLRPATAFSISVVLRRTGQKRQAQLRTNSCRWLKTFQRDTPAHCHFVDRALSPRVKLVAARCGRLFASSDSGIRGPRGVSPRAYTYIKTPVRWMETRRLRQRLSLPNSRAKRFTFFSKSSLENEVYERDCAKSPPLHCHYASLIASIESSIEWNRGGNVRRFRRCAHARRGSTRSTGRIVRRKSIYSPLER